MRSPVRRFRFPAAWFALWAVMIAGVIVLSVMRGPPIPAVLTIGKFDHFIAYAALAAFAVQLYASRAAQCVAAIAMVALGVGLELAQGYLATWRDMSLFDAYIDTAGVALGLATSWTPLAALVQTLEARCLR